MQRPQTSIHFFYQHIDFLVNAEKSKREKVSRCRSNPPPLSVAIPDLRDLCNVPYKSWKYAQLPIDVLLLTVKDEELLSCLSFLDDSYKSYVKALGLVYFGKTGDGQKKVKISLVRCNEGPTHVGGAQNVVRNAIKHLRPKVVFSVGSCGGVSIERAKLGDVVVLAKLTTCAEQKIVNDCLQWCGTTSNASRNIGAHIKSAADGWKAPLNDIEACRVQVHRNAEILTGLNLENCPEESEKLSKQFPGAIATEPAGQGKVCKLQKVVSNSNMAFSSANTSFAREGFNIELSQ